MEDDVDDEIMLVTVIINNDDVIWEQKMFDFVFEEIGKQFGCYVLGRIWLNWVGFNIRGQCFGMFIIKLVSDGNNFVGLIVNIILLLSLLT